MDTLKIGKFIKEMRIEKGMTQEKLASLIPISRQAVSKWELGITLPDYNVLLRLSTIFNISVSELLAGERNTQKDVVKDIYEDGLNIRRKFKKISTIVILVLILLITLFLTYYFFSSYNTTKVYTITGEVQNFTISSGILIKTNEKLYFTLGNIDTDKEISNLVLYYILDDEETIIYKTDANNIVFCDFNGYEEYIIFDSIYDIINNMYLRIYYEDTYEEIKLNFVEDYVNDSLIFLKKDNISEELNDTQITNDSLLIINNIKDKYNNESGNYTFNMEYNGYVYDVIFTEAVNIINLYVRKDNDTNIIYIYYLDYGYLDYINYEEDIFFTTNSLGDCLSESCISSYSLQDEYNNFIEIINLTFS